MFPGEPGGAALGAYGATNATGGACDDSQGNKGDFVIGVGIALIGSTIIPLGMNLQRMAHLQIAANGG